MTDDLEDTVPAEGNPPIAEPDDLPADVPNDDLGPSEAEEAEENE